MLHLCPDRRLFVLTTLNLRFGADRLFLALGWSAVGFIFDLFPPGISDNGIIPFFDAEISAVPINSIFLPEIDLSYVRAARRLWDQQGVHSLSI